MQAKEWCASKFKEWAAIDARAKEEESKCDEDIPVEAVRTAEEEDPKCDEDVHVEAVQTAEEEDTKCDEDVPALKECLGKEVCGICGFEDPVPEVWRECVCCGCNVHHFCSNDIIHAAGLQELLHTVACSTKCYHEHKNALTNKHSSVIHPVQESNQNTSSKKSKKSKEALPQFSNLMKPARRPLAVKKPTENACEPRMLNMDVSGTAKPKCKSQKCDMLNKYVGRIVLLPRDLCFKSNEKVGTLEVRYKICDARKSGGLKQKQDRSKNAAASHSKKDREWVFDLQCLEGHQWSLYGVKQSVVDEYMQDANDTEFPLFLTKSSTQSHAADADKENAEAPTQVNSEVECTPSHERVQQSSGNGTVTPSSLLNALNECVTPIEMSTSSHGKVFISPDANIRLPVEAHLDQGIPEAVLPHEHVSDALYPTDFEKYKIVEEGGIACDDFLQANEASACLVYVK